MNTLLKIITFSILVSTAFSAIGMEVGQNYTTAQWQCFKQAGHSFAIQRAYESNIGINIYATPSLTNAKAAGLRTDISVNPCRGRTTLNQTGQIVNKISPDLYENIWIIVGGPASGTACDWQSDFTSNCNFLSDLIAKLKQKKKNVGIFSTPTFWTAILGSTTSCTKLNTVPLWYYNLDNSESLNNFQPFGGFTKPAMKTFGLDQTCGLGYKKIYHP